MTYGYLHSARLGEPVAVSPGTYANLRRYAAAVEITEQGFARTRARSAGLDLLPGPPAWASQAACLGLAGPDRDPWHPPLDVPPSVRRALAAEAIAVCVTCPVQVACGRYGIELLADESVIAVYGGMEPGMLRDIARRIGRATRKTAKHGSRAKYVGGCRCELCRAANARGEKARRAATQRPGCLALTAIGYPCGRTARPGSVFCGFHAIPDVPTEPDWAAA